MALSQNLIFKGKCPSDSDLDPPGEEIVNFLHKELKIKEWKVSDPDIVNGGWGFECSKGAAHLAIAVGGNENLWYLQIFRTYNPGFIGNLLNKKPSATEKDIFDLAVSVHELISNKYHNLKWAWDDDPLNSKNSTPTPTQI